MTLPLTFRYLSDFRNPVPRRRPWAVDHFMMMMPPGLPQKRFRHYAQLFADKVLPAFR